MQNQHLMTVHDIYFSPTDFQLVSISNFMFVFFLVLISKLIYCLMDAVHFPFMFTPR